MIHTRSQLIDWIRENVTDRILMNAIATGSVECLGGFNPLPASTNPGWLVQVKSPFGPTHLIAVARSRDFRLHWFQAPGIPWETWVGDQSNEPLYQGDQPKRYAELKSHDPRSARIA